MLENAQESTHFTCPVTRKRNPPAPLRWFSNSYRGTTDDAAILRVTGEKGASFFKQSFELKIKGDMIPEAAAEEIIGELQALFARHNAGAALNILEATEGPTINEIEFIFSK